jgi:hypothetical protein
VSKLKETDDCSIVAVALACRTSYAAAKAALERHGKEPNDGAYPYQIRRAVERLGHQCIVMTNSYMRYKTLRTLSRQLTYGTWIVLTCDHCLCIRDGRKYDTHTDLARTEEVYFINP